MKRIKKFLSIVLALIIFISMSIIASAKDGVAQNIAGKTEIGTAGFRNAAFLTDGDIDSYVTSENAARITLKNNEGISGIYILLGGKYGEFTITDNKLNKTIETGKSGIAHRYISISDLFGKELTDITLTFENAVSVSEIYIFGEGKLPDYVQVWEPTLEGGADLALFTAHGDDEHLYFAGLLPLYAGEKGLKVQVVYLTYHQNHPERLHEMLNGLWAVGVRNYPVLGDFVDFRVDNKEKTYERYEWFDTSKDDLQSFVVEQIRRIKPTVAVGHDINGEYGHGMHLVYSELLREGISLAQNLEKYPESYKKYGGWQIKKTYIHSYGENKITMNYDLPLSSFGGKTAFEVSQNLGFSCHKSQLEDTVFSTWIYGKNGEIKKATDIKTFSPCEYGLYQSTVGLDTGKGDMFENIKAEDVKPPDVVNRPNEETKPDGNLTPILIFILIVIAAMISSTVIINKKTPKKR